MSAIYFWRDKRNRYMYHLRNKEDRTGNISASLFSDEIGALFGKEFLDFAEKLPLGGKPIEIEISARVKK